LNNGGAAPINPLIWRHIIARAHAQRFQIADTASDFFTSGTINFERAGVCRVKACIPSICGEQTRTGESILGADAPWPFTLDPLV
jgi:hypothetical protein